MRLNNTDILLYSIWNNLWIGWLVVHWHDIWMSWDSMWIMVWEHGCDM